MPTLPIKALAVLAFGLMAIAPSFALEGNQCYSSCKARSTSGVAAGAAGLAPALSAPFVSTALAQTKTLKVLQWSHFVPQFDTWFDGFAKGWGKQNGITVTIDHIPHLEEPARAAAEVAAGAGHDLL